MATRKLEARLNTLLNHSLSVSTRKQYVKALNTWIEFHGTYFPGRANERGGSRWTTIFSTKPLPQYTRVSAAKFVAWLSLQGLSYSTIRTRVSAISFFYKLIGKDPFSSYAVRKVMEGQRKTARCLKRPKEPLTMTYLEKLVKALRWYSSDAYLKTLLKALMLTLYFCCLRIGEAVTSGTANHVIRLPQVRQVRDTVVITMKTFKHSKADVTLVLKRRTGQCCPVSALEKYLAIRVGDPKGPLFTDEGGLPLNRQMFSSHFRELLLIAHLNPDHFSTHSFRAGRATDMALEGTSHLLIQKTGRWNSTAYNSYIRPQKITLP